MPVVRRFRGSRLILLISVGAIAAIAGLQRRSARSRSAQVTLAHLESNFNALQATPYGRPGVPAAKLRLIVRSDQRQIVATLATLARDAPVVGISRVPGAVGADFMALSAVGDVAGYEPPSRLSRSEINQLTALAIRLETRAARVSGELATANRAYARRASVADTEGIVGSAAAILLLVAGFTLVYRRARCARAAAQRLATENARLAATRGAQARTDALTGLGNRRALNDDLAGALSGGKQVALTLALFDLDGFKNYNDTFGHPAGDALLARLGEGLQAAMTGGGTGYRIGGDEFCIVTPVEQAKAAALVALAAAALTEAGDAFQIGCSYGTVQIPQEASTPADALHIADQRMYELKASRASASRQSTDVLLTVLSERSLTLREHLIAVATLAVRTAQQLGLPAHEIKQIGLAAELHDIGKTAIPDAILGKPGPLNKEEWAFIRRHTLIGERIILAAPSLVQSASLVRSSHERHDGAGYPDKLTGDQIPLGASIIAVCDAFDAMTSQRPYRAARTATEAIAELRRCSGTQFAPHAVAALCAILENDDQQHATQHGELETYVSPAPNELIAK